MFPSAVLNLEVDKNMSVVEQLITLVDGMFDHIWHSPGQFAALSPANPAAPPVPFLGRVDTAAVLTIGVNPTLGGIEHGHFPERLTSEELTTRLLEYFSDGAMPGDERLSTWERALNRCGLSYRDGSAAHIEISPRPVCSIGTDKHFLFRELCRYDVSSLFRLLSILKNPRVLLMAGHVTPGFALNTFLKEVALEQGWQLLGDGQGENGLVYHSLFSQESSYDGFFVSALPEDPRGRKILLHSIAAHAEMITLLTSGTASLQSVD